MSLTDQLAYFEMEADAIKKVTFDSIKLQLITAVGISLREVKVALYTSSLTTDVLLVVYLVNSK